MSARRRAALDAPEAAFGAFAEVRARLDELRAEAARLRSELEHEAGRPVPEAEVSRRLDAALDELRRSAGEQLVVGGLVSAAGGRFGDHLASLRLSPLAVAAVVAPDGLRSWLLDSAKAVLARLPEPADAPTRHDRLGELHRRLAATERLEADLLWSAEAQGLELPWRADLDPAAVLGLSEED